MMELIEHKYLDSLVDIGLNLREARIYLSLLTRHDFSVTEVARAARLSRPAAYELLNKMVMLGICKEKPGKIKRFLAVSPGEALPRLIEYQAEENKAILEGRQNKITELAPALGNIFEQSRGQEDPLDYFEVLRDKKQIALRFNELQRRVQREMQAFTKPPYVTPLDENPIEYDVLKRGVSVRGIYEYEGDFEYFKNSIGPYSLAGEKARVAKSLPTKMAIFDNKTSFFALKDPITGKVSITTLSIVHEDFSMLLREAFEAYWAKAIPFEEFLSNPTIIDKE
jgi:sugar-specific transcriptional regulator TrmB